MKSGFEIFTDAVASTVVRALATAAVVGVLALAISLARPAEAGGDGSRSPFRTIIQVSDPIPFASLWNGFARVSFPLPQNAEILDAEIRQFRRGSWKRGRIRITAAVDDREPIVWRAIAFQVAPAPETQPSDDLLDVDGRLLAYDLGDFAEPPPP